MTDPEIIEYLKSLKPGDKVIETTEGSMMTGKTGVVYISTNKITEGSICVMWKMADDQEMGSSATWGTRKIEDV